MFQQMDRLPVTLLVALAYVTLAFVTGVFEPDPKLLDQFGALEGRVVTMGEPWRLVTHAFLHGGFMHLAFNTYALLMFGPVLELQLGSLKFALLYLVAAIGGGAVADLWNGPLTTVIGGSGALFGMMGALIAVLSRRGRHALEFLEQPGGKQLIWILAINLVLSWVVPFISNSAHLGGLFSGFVITWFVLSPGRIALDRAGRFLRSGAIAAYLAIVFYACFPFARWDYMGLKFLETEDRNAKIEAARAHIAAYPGLEGLPYRARLRQELLNWADR